MSLDPDIQFLFIGQANNLCVKLDLSRNQDFVCVQQLLHVLQIDISAAAAKGHCQCVGVAM